MPRSPSRDLADRYIGNRDYFQQPDWIRRAKHWLALVALGLTVGWLVYDRVVPSAAYTHTHGPLADVHAAFDSNCEACHQGFSARDFGLFAVFRTHQRWHTLTCNKCHGGPAHHATVTDTGKAYHDACANCHHDHQGRTNPLVRIADRHCTECHANLPANTAGGGPNYEHKVTNFAKDHPEFKVLRESAGKPYADRKLKFSHWVHMSEGITYDKDGRGKWTLKEITDPSARERYRKPGQSDTAAVQLECASCHRLDSGTRYDANTHEPTGEFDRLMRLARGEPRSALLPPRAAGAYYLPVNYETDCKACHAITVPPTTVGDGQDRTVLDGFTVPHRFQGDELRAAVAGPYTQRLLAGGKKLNFTLGPGGRLDERARPEAARFNKELKDRTDAALATLFRGADPADKAAGRDGYPAVSGGTACGKCHTGAGVDKVVEVPNRTVWFGHAKFDHVAHRAVRCADCHPGTDAEKDPGDTKWTGREPVLIAGVDTCKQCHAPAGTKVEAGGKSFAGGGVPADCALCHRYHNGDNWLQGRGAKARDPQAPLSVEEFFRGKKKD